MGKSLRELPLFATDPLLAKPDQAAIPLIIGIHEPCLTGTSFE